VLSETAANRHKYPLTTESFRMDAPYPGSLALRIPVRRRSAASAAASTACHDDLVDRSRVRLAMSSQG
jgi:hypothetical protein